MRLSCDFSRFELVFQRAQVAAAFLLPLGVPLEFQKAIPGFDGVHDLAAVFHHEGLIEEDDGIVGSQFVCPAQVVERGCPVVFAAGRDSAQEVGGTVIEQQARSHRAGGHQTIKNVDCAVIVFLQHFGACLQLKPMGIGRSLFQVALDLGARIKQRGRFAICSAAAQMHGRGDRRKAGAGNAQIGRARIGVGFGQQALRSVVVAPPDGDAKGKNQGSGKA